MSDVVSLSLQPEPVLRHASADSFKAGMRRLASGVALVTSADDTGHAGLIATAVNSVSAAPPTLLACVNRSASAHDVIERSGCLCINLLTEGDLDLVDVFSRTARREERFRSGDWRTLTTGAPALQSALVAFDCEVVQRFPYETHTIFLGIVRDVHLPEGGLAPLVYLNSAFRRLESII